MMPIRMGSLLRTSALPVSYTHLSRGEYTLTSPAVILDGVDMDSLTGTTQIYFLLNGTPYLYELEADGYYLDTRVLRCLNEAFGKEQIPGRLYGADYDGWSCILSVSYTHLDVYKRQVWKGIVKGDWGGYNREEN